jgi:hypothetical protein
MLPAGGANNRLFSRAENIRLLHRVCRKLLFIAQLPAARDDRLSKYSSSAGPPLLQRVVAGWLVSARRPEAINDVLRLKEPFRRHSSAKVTREITRDDAIAK